MSSKRPKKRPRRWGLWLLALVFGVPTLAFALAKTEWARERAARLATRAIHDELGLDARLGDVEVLAFPPTVVARGIALSHPVHGELVTADSLRVSPSLLAVLRGAVDLDQIEISRPVFRLVIRDGKVVNFPELPESGGGETNLPFSDLAIDRATIEIDLEPRGRLRVTNLDADLTVENGNILELRASSRSGVFRHVMGDENVEELTLRARIAPDSVLVHELNVRTPAAYVLARRAHISLGDPVRADGRFDVGVDLARAAALPHDLELPPLSGTVVARGQLAWDGEHVRGSGHVSLGDVVIKSFGTGDVELDVTVDEYAVRVTEGRVSLVKDGGHLDLTATLGLSESLPLELHANISDLEFAKLMDQLGVSENAIENWFIGGTAELRGTCNPLDLSGPIHARTHDFEVWTEAYHSPTKSHVIAVERADIDGTIAVRPAGFSLENLDARLPRSRMHADVLLGFDNALRVSARATELDLADGNPIFDFEVGGRGSLAVEVTGTMSDPEVRGHAVLNDFVFDGKRFGDLETDWQLEEGGVAVRMPMIVATKNESRYRVEDFFMNFSDGRMLIEGVVHADDMRLSDYYAIMLLDGDERFEKYQARAHGRVPLRYTRGFPGDLPSGSLLVDIDLTLDEANLVGFAFGPGSLRGRWDWRDWERGLDGGVLTVEHGELTKAGGTVVVEGRMTMGSVLELTTVASGVPIESLEGFDTRMPELRGEASATGQIGGTLGKPRAHFDVQVAGLRWNGNALGAARAYVRLTDQGDPWVASARTWKRRDPPEGEACAHARVGFARGEWDPDPLVRTVDGLVPALEQPMAFIVCGEGLDGQVAVDMAIGQTKVYPLRGRIDLRELDATPFVARGFDALRRRVSASVTLTGGAMMEDDSLVGAISIADLRIGQAGVELANDGPIDVRLRRGNFEFRRANFVGPGTQIRLSGGGTVRELATRAEGDIDLALLSSLHPSISESQGHVGFEVRVSGPITAPEVFGSARIENGFLRLTSLPDPVEELEGEIAFSQRRIELTRFSAFVAGGSIDGRGVAELRGTSLDAYSATIHARNLTLHPIEGLDVALGMSSELSWRSGERVPTLRGNVDIERFLYERPIQLGQTLSDLSRRRRAIVERYDPDADRVALDLRVNADVPLRIANNLIDAEISIRNAERPFRIIGTDQRLGVLGSLGIDRGSIRFRNAGFDIQRGVVEFDDETQIDPRVDVLAVTQVRRSGDFAAPQWRITLRARGTTDALELETSAEPELSQEDIVLLLTLGMTRAEAQQLQAGQIGQTAALEALATVTGVDREVRNVLPAIDDFRFSSAYSVRTGRMEPQIAIGKRITERIRLSGMTGIGEARELRANLEWRLDDRTSLQAAYDNVNTAGTTTFGNVGADLRWRLEFE